MTAACLIPSIKFYYNDRQSFIAPAWSFDWGGCYKIDAPNGYGKTSYLKILMTLLQQYRPTYLGHDLGFIESYSALWHQKLYAFKTDHNPQKLSNTPVLMLSEGQKKIQALLLHLNNAALWILDEPFNALDEQYCTTLSSSITAHCTNGGSVILTSHLPICSKQQVYPIDTITLRCESV